MKRFFLIKLFIIAIIAFLLSILTFENMPQKNNLNKENDQEGIVKIYYRGLDFIKDDGIPEGPSIHPILKDWNNNYYELAKNPKNEKMEVLKGKLNDISKASQYYIKQNPKFNKIIKVDKNKFLKAVEEYVKKYKKQGYNPLNLSKNCIGFKNYILNKSKIQ